MKKALLPLLLLLSAGLPGLSQERLTDASAVRTDQDSNPNRFTASNDQLFFAAGTAREGNELWKTDGTPAGTTLVKDIYPGAEGSISGHPVALGNAVYFFANDGTRGVQLWKSDGSTGGTERVTDFLRGKMLGLTLVQDQLFFLLETAEYTWEVWRSNGTAAGTQAVKKDISGWNEPQNFMAVGNLFYFALQPKGSNDPDLWRSDGTAAGTFTVIGGIDGSGAGEGGTSGLTQFIVYKDELYFVARSSERFGYDQSVGILKTNGTVAGTLPVKGLHPGNARLIDQASVVLLAGKLYFSFYEVDLNRVFIWESDGTPEGTRKVYDVSSTAYLGPSTLASTGTELVFNAPGANQATALVKWDPATGETTILRETLPGTARPSFYVNNWQVTRIHKGEGNSLLINAPAEYGEMVPARRFWLCDGTPQGTVQLEEPQPNFRTQAAYFKGAFYASGLGKEVGTELYKVDAATGPAALLKNINLGKSSYLTHSRLHPFKDKVFFAAGDTINGTELWQSDGTRENTRLFKDINPGKSNSNAAINTGKELPVLGNKLLFHASTPEHGIELWSTDGTPEGTALVKDVVEGKGSSEAWYLTRLGNVAFFTAQMPSNGFAIWVTDGTTAGTRKFMELGVNEFGVALRVINLISAGKHLFFSVEGGDLWKTDGTEAGTIKLKRFYTLDNFMAVNDQVYFTAVSGFQGQYQLWKSDGTEAGTVQVKDALGDRLKTPQLLGESDGKVIFSAETAEHGRELWVTDGTENGTTLLKDIYPGAAGALAPAVPVAKKDNLLYFTANDGATGVELWQTDGTAAGTMRIKDILPGAGSSLPANLVLLDGQLYFSAFTPAYGMELWKSDGTDAGTVLVADVNPGAGHSNPTGMMNLGKDILFIADTDAHGRQLWRTNAAVTAVEDPLVASSVAVYPNPTDGEVTVRLAAPLTGPVAISTLDLTGKVLQSETIRTTAGLQHTVNLRSLSPGLYLLRIAGAQGTVTKKIIRR